MSELEKRRKWLTKKKIKSCLFLSGAILLLVSLLQFAQEVVVGSLPIEQKAIYVVVMWLFLAGLLLFYGLVSPDLMEIVFNMLGFKQEEPKKEGKNDEDMA